MNYGTSRPRELFSATTENAPLYKNIDYIYSVQVVVFLSHLSKVKRLACAVFGYRQRPKTHRA